MRKKYTTRPGRRPLCCPSLLERLEPRILATVVNSPVIPGDTNADGTINIVDITQIAQHWQQSADAPYDVTGDSFVDILDYTVVVQNWQKTIYDGRSVVVDSLVNIWIPDAAEAGTSKWVAQPSELYGASGKPTLPDIQSGAIDDSYFLAAIGSLASSQPTKIMNLITYDGTGWAVSFDGTLTGQTSAVIHVSREFSGDYQTRIPGTGVWWQVMEKAYAYYRTYNGTTSQNSFASLEGCTTADAWKTLGQSSTTLYSGGLLIDTTINLVRSALALGQPVVFNTYSSSAWLTPNHSYVVLSMTGAGSTATVVTFDPVGYYDFWTINEVLLSGASFTLGY